MKRARKRLGLAIFASGIVAMVAGAARAADTSPWSEDNHAAFRLIVGSNAAGAVFRAAVEIKLDPGWKTYWRYPGDSGVPPRFDFSRSENVAAVKVSYPAPHLFTDDAGNSLGYKDHVAFPLQVIAKQPDKPITLRLKLDYAVCEKLCIPAEGAADLVLSRGQSALENVLITAEKRVPKQIPADHAGLTVHRASQADRPLVIVDLKADAGAPVELFVEGPTAEWALPIPKPAAGAQPGHRQFSFELDGLPPGVDPKGHFELTFTIVEGEQAYEVKTRLD